jgi:hypothetical protein
MKQQLLETIQAYSEGMMARLVRQQRLHVLRMNEINGVFDVMWEKKIELIECGAFDPIFAAILALMKLTEEEAEMLLTSASLTSDATKGILEALKV